MMLTLTTEHPLVIDAAQIRAARVEAAQIAEQRRASRGTTSETDGVIGQFCAFFSVEYMLAECGYTQRRNSDDWQSTHQTSGSFATRNYGDYWVSLAGSDAAAGLGISTKSGHRTGDAFDLLCHFKHGGNEKAAYAGAAAMVSLSRTRQHMPQMPGTNTAPAVTLRDFETLKMHARYVTADDADKIHEILIEANALPRLKQEIILKALKAATGIGMGELRVALKEAHGDGNQEAPDHLTLARATLDGIGQENILCTDSGVWRWQASGVWREQEDRAVKKATQAALEARGVTVMNHAVNGVAEVLKNEIYRPGHAFNIGEPEVVNCLNGLAVLDGGRWTLRPHRREDYRTTQIPVDLDLSATAPLFRRFLGDVFRDDADRDDKCTCLLELMGYTLMSHSQHERFVMLLGPGGNGKSVALAVLEAMAGAENVAGVAPSKFESPYQRAHLKDKLANIVSELHQGEVIADAELKAITSGEISTVERKNRDPFDMRPFSTCWFGTNHLPHTRDFSDALFRRAVLLTFNRTFAEHEQDVTLKGKLFQELPGILQMCLTAYAHAVANGFTQPASSEAAKAEWRLDADQVAQFVQDACTREVGAKTPGGWLYEAYGRWAAAQGIKKTVNRETFSKRLQRLGHPTGKVTDGLRIYEHIKINSPEPILTMMPAPRGSVI
jgi:putative DNA primase/helicase